MLLLVVCCVFRRMMFECRYFLQMDDQMSLFFRDV
jgi:hypothetical protein